VTALRYRAGGFRQRTVAFALLAVAALVVSACGLVEEKKRYPCPKAFVLSDAGSLVRFKPGTGRDITDILFEARIADFAGTCEYDEKKKKGVSIEMNVVVDLQRGPASKTPDIAFEYFVAIPSFLPKPEGKKIFPVTGRFEETQNRLTYRDAVRMFIPLDDPNDGVGLEVVVGFQLTPEEIRFNKALRQP
jgi:hypothetical protein